MLKCFFVLLLFASSIFADTSVYQWKDANGTTHYSDAASNAIATAITPKKSSSYTPPLLKNTNLSKPTAKKITITGYTSLKILTPTNNFMYLNNESGDMTIELQLTPDLQKHDKIKVYLDGKSRGHARKALRFNLTNIDRGEHTLQIQIFDVNDKVLIKSNVVNFFMQRPFVKRKKR